MSPNKHASHPHTEPMEDAAEHLRNKVGEVRQSAQDLGSAVRDAAQQTAAQLRDTAAQRVDDFRETATQKAGELRDAATQKAGELRDAAAQRMDDLRETAGDYYAVGRDRAMDLEQGLEERIREKPLQSVLIAAGVGVLLGIVWMRR